jgi:hypothetical protein
MCSMDWSLNKRRLLTPLKVSQVDCSVHARSVYGVTYLVKGIYPWSSVCAAKIGSRSAISRFIGWNNSLKTTNHTLFPPISINIGGIYSCEN